jgi:hypothetical protein
MGPETLLLAEIQDKIKRQCERISWNFTEFKVSELCGVTSFYFYSKITVLGKWTVEEMCVKIYRYGPKLKLNVVSC